jgi:F-type H+-transporting ATPase subunit c
MSIFKKLDVLVYFLLICLVSTPLIAGSENVALVQHYSYFSLSAAFCVTITATTGTIAQSMAAQTALSGIARNPEASGKLFVPMILSLALIESLVLFSLVVSFLILGKIS